MKIVWKVVTVQTQDDPFLCQNKRAVITTLQQLKLKMCLVSTVKNKNRNIC